MSRGAGVEREFVSREWEFAGEERRGAKEGITDFGADWGDT